MSFAANTGAGNTTTQNQLPEWLQSAYQDNISRAENVANAPTQGYSGPLSAGDNGYLSAARDQAGNVAQAGQGQIADASNVYSQIANQSPFFQNSGRIAGSDLGAYTNPYENTVVQNSLNDIELQRQRAMNDSNASTPRGAFGGSRQGVSDSLTNESYGRLSADTAAQLRQQGYTQAQGLRQQDIGNAQTDNALNTNIDQANTAANLQAAGGLLATGGQQQQSALAAQSALQQAGQNLQGTQQSGFDTAYQEWLRQQQDPYQKQTLVNSAVLGISPGAVGTQNQTSNSKAKGLSS